MIILALETSCDETSAAVIDASKDKVEILSNVVSSSLPLHSKTGGIIPEIAAREQVKFIIPVIEKAIEECKLKIENLDSIAVTYGPGLIGSLIVGVETARTLSLVWKKPIVPVNHLIGHIYANFIGDPNIEFPAIALIVSGGHTDLLLIKNHGKIKWLGGTRDDAAGEAFDKIGRLLNLPYPAGPTIETLAKKGSPKAFDFPRPMIGSGDFDFSFSGLKAAVAREVKGQDLSGEFVQNICASTQEAITDILIRKTLLAAKKDEVKSVLLGGGVAANQKLRDEFKSSIANGKLSIKFFAPPKNLCTDNAAMIAAAAFYNYKPIEWKKVTASPELYFD